MVRLKVGDRAIRWIVDPYSGGLNGHSCTIVDESEKCLITDEHLAFCKDTLFAVDSYEVTWLVNMPGDVTSVCIDDVKVDTNE